MKELLSLKKKMEEFDELLEEQSKVLKKYGEIVNELKSVKPKPKYIMNLNKLLYMVSLILLFVLIFKAWKELDIINLVFFSTILIVFMIANIRTKFKPFREEVKDE